MIGYVVLCCHFWVIMLPEMLLFVKFRQKMLDKVNWEVLGASWGGINASWVSLGRAGSSFGRRAEVLVLLGKVLVRSG